MSTSTPKTRTLHERIADVGCGRCVRLRLILDPDGEPEELRIEEGWHDGGSDPRRAIGPLPGRVLGDLIAALTALQEAIECEA